MESSMPWRRGQNPSNNCARKPVFQSGDFEQSSKRLNRTSAFEGETYSFEEIAEWLTEAGLGPPIRTLIFEALRRHRWPGLGR